MRSLSSDRHYRSGSQIAGISAMNARQIQPRIDHNSAPMHYYRAFKDISVWLPPNVVIIGEGANTMDIDCDQMPSRHARLYLDAGSYGTMEIDMASCSPRR